LELVRNIKKEKKKKEIKVFFGEKKFVVEECDVCCGMQTVRWRCDLAVENKTTQNSHLERIINGGVILFWGKKEKKWKRIFSISLPPTHTYTLSKNTQVAVGAFSLIRWQLKLINRAGSKRGARLVVVDNQDSMVWQ
jgi:hypothetical protein